MNQEVPQSSAIFRSPHYGWVIVALAAVAMIATLPGRTHGLGMITERLLADESLHLDRQSFGYINLRATLIGALFCFPVGWALDRWGLRITSALVAASLGLVVMGMTHVVDTLQFSILIGLTRGLGQSALSVVSISMTGKWFTKQLPLATGVYSLLVSLGFAAAFVWGRGQSELPWREQWFFLGQLLLFVITPMFLLFVRSAPSIESNSTEATLTANSDDFTLREALVTPAFWTFGLATSFYGLVSSGVSLFNESLLAERDFPKSAFYDLGTMTTGIGLAANLLTGWAATRVPITVLAGIAMGLLSLALFHLTVISTYPELVVYAVTMGCAGGMVTVLFFTIWARLFGRGQLGKIQSVAQMLTVVASALGPVVLAEFKVRCGTYFPAIIGLGTAAAILAVTVVIVPIPRRESVPNVSGSDDTK